MFFFKIRPSGPRTLNGILAMTLALSPRANYTGGGTFFEHMGEDSIIEMERAPFDILFREMDCFVIHGGLGTTVDALRMHRPIAVIGVLLMDQRGLMSEIFPKW